MPENKEAVEVQRVKNLPAIHDLSIRGWPMPIPEEAEHAITKRQHAANRQSEES